MALEESALIARGPTALAELESSELRRNKSLSHSYNLNATGRGCYFEATPQHHLRPLAFDIGVNQAGDARHLLYQGYRVVSVEADPIKYRKHSSDPFFERYRRTGQWTLVNAALTLHSEVGRNVTFWINLRKPDSSSTDPRLACQGSKPPSPDRCIAVQVPTVSCSALIRSFGVPFYLKSDVEGHDDDCFSELPSPKDAWRLPPYVQYEALLPVLGAPAAWRERVPWHALSLLHKRGYVGFKISNQAQVNLFGNSPAFAHGDEWSGPIGEAAVDTVTQYDWNTYQNVKERLRLWQRWQTKHTHTWLDVIARLDPTKMCRMQRPIEATFEARCIRRACSGY